MSEMRVKQRLLSPAELDLIKTEWEEYQRTILRKGDFDEYLNTFDSHKRFPQFVKIVPRLSPAQFWKLLADVWTNSEVIKPDERTWLRFFQSKRKGRKFLMTPKEHKALAKLPDEIEIWRGCGHKDGVRGLSWTLERTRAAWFAVYACGGRRGLFAPKLRGRTLIVAKAVCSKTDVLAHFLEREESEIIVNPKNVKVLQLFRPSRSLDTQSPSEPLDEGVPSL
jgi:hypothetical protein